MLQCCFNSYSCSSLGDGKRQTAETLLRNVVPVESRQEYVSGASYVTPVTFGLGEPPHFYAKYVRTEHYSTQKSQGTAPMCGTCGTVTAFTFLNVPQSIVCGKIVQENVLLKKLVVGCSHFHQNLFLYFLVYLYVKCFTLSAKGNRGQGTHALPIEPSEH